MSALVSHEPTFLVTSDPNNISHIGGPPFNDTDNITDVFRRVEWDCSKGWRSENHAVFQIANACILVGFAAPNSKLGNLSLHGLLMFGFLLESAWAWVVICAPDVFSWNFSFMAVNLIQMLYILYQLKPVKFSPEVDEVYAKIFEPLRVPRPAFKKLTSSTNCTLSSLHTGEAYAVQNVTRADKLGLLITGSVSVYCKQQLLHTIGPMEFIDSPEFDATAAAEDKYQASIIATEPCRYILWGRSNVSYLLAKQPYLSHVMATLIARDITNKLYVLNDKAMSGRGRHLDIRLPAVAAFLSGVPQKHREATPCNSPQTVTDTMSEEDSSVTGVMIDTAAPTQVSDNTYTYTNGTAPGNQQHTPSVSNDDFTKLGRWDSKTILV